MRVKKSNYIIWNRFSKFSKCDHKYEHAQTIYGYVHDTEENVEQFVSELNKANNSVYFTKFVQDMMNKYNLLSIDCDDSVKYDYYDYSEFDIPTVDKYKFDLAKDGFDILMKNIDWEQFYAQREQPTEEELLRKGDTL